MVRTSFDRRGQIIAEPSDHTGECAIRAGGAKEHAKVLDSSRRIGDIDYEANQSHDLPEEDVWTANLVLIGEIGHDDQTYSSEDERRDCE